MIVFEYKPEYVYKILKHYDWKYNKKDIAWDCEDIINSEYYERILINEWHNNNNYYYYCSSVNYKHVYNIMNFYNLFKGIIFSEEVYNNKEQFSILNNFCIENNLKIILLKEVSLYELRELL